MASWKEVQGEEISPIFKKKKLDFNKFRCMFPMELHPTQS
jgi:hypothetical protein